MSSDPSRPAVHTRSPLFFEGVPAPGVLRGAVSATIGSFDGVHIGHQRLLRFLSRDARRREGRTVVITFDPHPRCVVDPTGCPSRLTTVAERARLLHRHGADHVCVLRFTRALSRWSAPRFCDEVLRSLDIRCLMTGPGFALGHKREGDAAFLREYGAEHGFEVQTVAPAVRGGEPVSSSRIRAALQAGRVGAASSLLGRDHLLEGAVVRGDGRGRTLGFPTANLDVGSEACVPAAGVYATWLTTDAGVYAAATSIGVRPTFDGASRTIEAFALDFDADLYGRRVALSFVSRLRSERRFRDAEALVVQMRRDVERVRTRLLGAPA